MKKSEKGRRIDVLEAELTKSTLGILTDYRGLKTPEMNALRRKMQESGGDYKVVKNTLAIKAAERINRQEITGIFTGPIAVAFGNGDVTQTAKVFSDFVRTSRIALTVKGGFMSGRTLTAQEITTLATLPPKQVLIAQVVGGIKSPLYSLVGVLSGPMRGLQGILQARIKQLEGSN